MHRNEAQTKYHFCGFIFDTLSIYLIVFTNRTIKILLSIKLCNVTSHVTIIGNRLLPAGWNLCLVVKYFLLVAFRQMKGNNDPFNCFIYSLTINYFNVNDIYTPSFY